MLLNFYNITVYMKGHLNERNPDLRIFSRNICRFSLWIQLNWKVRIKIFYLSFVSRETKVAKVAEKLCLV